MEKIAYQLDGAGYLVGHVQCDPDPLEPGRWLIPGGCVEVAPPDVVQGAQLARYVAGAWTVEEIPQPEPEPQPEPQA